MIDFSKDSLLNKKDNQDIVVWMNGLIHEEHGECVEELTRTMFSYNKYLTQEDINNTLYG